MISADTYSQVYSFLNTLGYDYIIKLPEKIWIEILNKKNDEYNPKYELNDFKEIGKISREAKYIILSYQLRYFCKDENERKEIKKILEENEKKLNEKYAVFKKHSKENKNPSNSINNSLIDTENKKFINRLKIFITKLFNKFRIKK